VDKITELRKQKEKINEEIRKINEENKKQIRNNRNGNANVLTRVGSEFNQAIEKLIEERLDKGMDETRVSKPKITNLIVKHKLLWPPLRLAILNYNFLEAKKDD